MQPPVLCDFSNETKFVTEMIDWMLLHNLLEANTKLLQVRFGNWKFKKKFDYSSAALLRRHIGDDTSTKFH